MSNQIFFRNTGLDLFFCDMKNFAAFGFLSPEVVLVVELPSEMDNYRLCTSIRFITMIGIPILHDIQCFSIILVKNIYFVAKRVAASCVWLAGKLEESPRKSKHIIFVFHRMECRRENLPIEFLDVFSKKYSELRRDLIRTERHLLKEMGFICHVEHPHKFISNYLATLEAPPELTQEAWNLANDSLRTTLCVRFKSEVVACGVVYAAARRHRVPLPEDPPWWTVFDADEAGIQEVCSVLAHLYSLPKAQYIPVYKEYDSFTVKRISDPQALKESPARAVASDKGTPIPSSSNQEKDSVAKTIPNRVKEKSDDEGRHLPAEFDGKENLVVNSKIEKSDSGVDWSRERERERERSRGRERDARGRDSDHDSRGRDSDRERDRRRRSRDRSSGHSDKEKSRRHPSH
ncbi:hypothetical protein ACJX0J_009438, partial [Zea mays]